MKKRSIVNLLSAAFMLIFFSACSKQQFTFAPGTGAYHGQNKQAPEVAATPETSAYAATETAAPAPEAISTPQTDASAALAQAVTAKKQAAATAAPEIETATKADKKAARQTLMQV
ncbi:MAG TPA: hypothetical protein VK927_03930, partial [Adhaeribacter sp.]|nr:hypothetical protein [Adhaeribacter sp.]